MSLATGPVSCAEDCEFELPRVKFAECDPEINLSQISDIYAAQPDAASLSDWTDPAVWAARLSETSTDADAIRPIKVVGDKPKPETQTKIISGKRKIVTDKNHVINFEIDESNIHNHYFARGVKCIKKLKIWYGTIGGLLFGGNDGIEATFEIDMTLSRTEGDIVLYAGTLSWSTTELEERIDSPIA